MTSHEQQARALVAQIMKEAHPDAFDPNVWAVPPGMSEEELTSLIASALREATVQRIEDILQREINKEVMLSAHAREVADFEGAREHEYAIFVLRHLGQQAEKEGG